MDYVVGSVAALITGAGNTTPNRPRHVKRALTPTKHQPSPNVTPKSELVDDRSIFLSPSLQKKKAIVKKSPKRIFENPDLDVTNGGEGNSSIISPKANKVKKHLKDDLEADTMTNFNSKPHKSPKEKHNKSVEAKSPKKIKIGVDVEEIITKFQTSNESTPKKNKKQRNSISEPSDDAFSPRELKTVVNIEENNTNKSPKKKKKRQLILGSADNMEIDEKESEIEASPEITPNNESITKKIKKKRKLSESLNENSGDDANNTAEEHTSTTTVVTDNNQQKPNKKKKKNKPKKKKPQTQADKPAPPSVTTEKPQKKKKKNIVNPNAITSKDSDSEHESDNEIESETEQTNNEILDTGPIDDSSDEEEQKKPDKKEQKEIRDSEEEIRRTLFVGNVLFNNKCKKEVKSIFSKYGTIETVRIRTVPVKDARVTPKLAVIRNELHPDRTTVNVYVKFSDPSSIDKAVVENNKVLNGHHLRVSRSNELGVVHDPKCSVFVGNLPFALEDEAFRAKFEGCGEIESVRIIRDRKTNAGKGFGYINFASKDGVELALAMSEEDLTIKNRILRVKRCTYTQKQSQNNNKFSRNDTPGRGFQGKNQGRSDSQGRNQGFQGRNQGFQDRNQGFQDRNQGYQGRNQGFQGRNQGFKGPGGFRRNQEVEGKNQGFQGRNQGFQGRNQGFQGRNQGEQERNQGGFKGPGGFKHQNDEGAYRRIMKKRHNQDEGEGPPSKKSNVDQPKEKKARKEFVGMTAEKKKKPKVNKGQKKKKALSEILTK